jgi:hypothetical protein
MLHWRYKFPALLLVSLSVASTLGKLHAIGFFW